VIVFCARRYGPGIVSVPGRVPGRAWPRRSGRGLGRRLRS
jgi:hypothetical protein